MKKIVLGLSFALTLCSLSLAQQSAANINSAQQVVVPRLLRFSGQLSDANGKPLTSTIGVTFSLYKSQTDKASLWIETQNVKPDAEGKYSVLLGATKSGGMPVDLFSSGDARWLGMTVDGREQPRVLLVSVPYALKAAEAETLAGHAATDFVTSEKLTTTVKEQVKQATSSTPKSDATTNAAQPATTFAASNSTQVVGVTQSGAGAGIAATATTGIALRGASSGIAVFGSTSGTGSSPAVQGNSASPAGSGVLGYNNAATGTPIGVYGQVTGPTGVGVSARATSATGATRGIVANVASPSGLAGLFINSATTGNILSAYGAGSSTAVFNVSTGGNVTAKGIFYGNGSGLTGVNASKIGGVALTGLPTLAGVNDFTNQQYVTTAKSNFAAQFYNTSTTGSLGAGVTAFANNPNGIGVYGEADTGESSGVFGYTRSAQGAGVYGQFSKAANIYGSCCTGYKGIGMWADTGNSSGIALLATADATDAAIMYNNSKFSTLYVENDYPSSSGTAYVFFAGNGNNSGGCGIDTLGNLNCSGSITGTVPGGGGKNVEMYGVQSTENWYEDAGSAKLQNGVASVQFDSNFAAVANTSVTYQVFLTPNGDCKGLYVANKGPAGFEVRELGGGAANIGFDYRIVAKRKGAESVRMRPVADNVVRNAQGVSTGVSGPRSSLRPTQE